ncbi:MULTISPECIES: alanine--tRNA ligase [unclassified Azospirillum]|uniref:alanine--tRNA ligase n=1 Tax=unclassified Azospirillum TaxID=2630922 RepID=UPI000B6F88CA|nr:MULTISPECIES: alanine--tRNA ligase [unclassified Azospirillum]SNS39419.1 alanyl-tRNA synthetase [Azospirillum sp. RU38E]SNS57797.1 alanyl-tRNA synthetase [Azospirillum sp. RU37A]
MSKKTVNEIRSTFLDYFGKNGHAVVDSSPLVPRNDPTLMFTNAGMVQFKNVFTGQEARPYSRATTSQKCVRAGGKHNDLENVGYTARHHTFFEMLGNFSFGDYFKADAIELAWNLITKEFGISKEKLTVTVYHTDDEAFGLWKKIAGFSDDKIIRIPTSDNFWMMGDTGPCGPCSEIFYDHGAHIPGGPPGSPDEDGDRFIEIWNLVFMQYEQLPGGERVALPKPSIDTGMGMERLSAVLQGVHDNYDIDLFKGLLEASAEATGASLKGPQATSHRVIADHLRSCSFLIADGVMPSNEGRGYVLRRIMRRAMRHAHMLGAKEPVMHRLVPALVREMGGHYAELVRAQALITETLRLEETRFKQTLERGLKLLDEAEGNLADGQALPGNVAFTLYDTYGFPLDLTQDVLRGRKRGVDVDGFNAAMDEQRKKARASWAGSGEAATDRVWFEVKDELGATEFLGYDTETAEGTVTAILDKEGKRLDKAEAGQEVLVVTNQTPFYGESGGQVGDAGLMISAKGAEVTVRDVQKKLGAVFAHVASVTKGTLAVGDAVELKVDGARRGAIRANHSATHLLHEALRRRMGEHVTQKGSLVSADRLRFDISQPTPLSAADIAEVEAQVNERIRGNSEVTTRLMTPDAAIEIGAMALFGEKYGEEVRVVSMGGVDAHGNKEFSVELCGGTHVRRTGDIGLFKVVSEGAVAAGIRRVEALTGAGALAYLEQQEGRLLEAAQALKVPAGEVVAKVTALVDERRKLEKELAELRRQVALGGGGGGAASEVKQINGLGFIGRVVADLPAKDLKPFADELKKQVGTGVVVAIAVADGKASVVVGVTEDAVAKVSAVDLVRVAAGAMGGKGGGGRPDMAQAGGPDGDKAADAIAAVEAALAG